MLVVSVAKCQSILDISVACHDDYGLRAKSMRIAIWLVSIAVLAMNAADSMTDDSVAANEDSFESLAQRYGIEIVWQAPVFPADTTWGKINGHAADAADLARYRRLFCEEFSLYPRTLIEKTKLKRIVLCQGLTFAGQRRFAIPDFEHDAYYLDVGSKDQTDHYLCKVIHHDLFHIIDYRDDGLLYEDERWKMLNPPDFKYGKGGAEALNDSTTGELTDRYPGFLNHYSTTGVEEDKAEIFAHLIVSRKFVSDRTAADDVIRLKAERLKSLVREFCDDMDDAFWVRANKVNRRQF